MVEHSRVHWEPGYDLIEEGTELFYAIHRIPVDQIRLPNDGWVRDEAVTLEEMRSAGAL